jgi:PadR family transcriptional regulator PadR
MRGPHQHRRGRRGVRTRRLEAPGEWAVRARVERFVEPSILLLLREGPKHGYELLDLIPELGADEGRIDLGNLYRVLRALEEEGLVTSEWSADLPGPTKRTYTLTREGHELLAAWLASIERLRDGLTTFLETTQEGGDHVRTPPQAQVGTAGSEP